MPPSLTSFYAAPVTVDKFLEATRQDVESRGGGLTEVTSPSGRTRTQGVDEASIFPASSMIVSFFSRNDIFLSRYIGKIKFSIDWLENLSTV